MSNEWLVVRGPTRGGERWRGAACGRCGGTLWRWRVRETTAVAGTGTSTGCLTARIEPYAFDAAASCARRRNAAHQGPAPHLPQAGQHLREEVLAARVEDVKLDADVRVRDRHLLRAELDATRHLVRLRELLARGAEHLHQGGLAHGRVAGLCTS